jgi:hypothetical protein
MGDAAVVGDNGGDVTGMMQHLEELQREREQLDARSTALAVEDEQLIQCVEDRIDERERIRLRLLAIDSEDADIDARREAIEDEQRALVASRDALDHEYTELYALLDRVADGPAVPSSVTPALTERIPGVSPPPLLSRPAPWRTTLVIVPDASAPTPVVAPIAPVKASKPKPWETWRGVLVISASLIAVITIGAIAAWPEAPAPEPTVDPKAALEMVRAAFVPESATTTPTAAAAPPVAEPAAVQATPRPKKRARSKRSRTETKKKTAR